MTGTDEEALESIVALALEQQAAGHDMALDQLCAERPDLMPQVARALGRSNELVDLHRAARGFDAWATRELAGRYRLDARLGAGSMGVVYRGQDLELRRPVAVKILRSDLLDGDESEARFEREAEVLAAIHHPTVVTVFDRGRTPDGLMFLVMELLEGVPLSELLEQAEKIASQQGGAAKVEQTGWLAEHLDLDADIESSYLRQSVRWISDICGGLEAVHAAGVLHRDIKPSNVFIRKNGAPVLVDFGIAARNAEGTISDRGGTIGTPAYLAPDQLNDERPPTERVDVYGLCATLYHMLTLRAPFRGTPPQILASMQRRDPPPAFKVRPGLPRDLQAVLDCGMARPNQRYPSAKALGGDLRAFLSFQPVSVRPTTAAARVGRMLWRSREARAGAAVVAVVLAIVTILTWVSADREARREQWVDAWSRIPPALYDAPRYLRRIEDMTAQRAVEARLDRLVELDVEPLPSYMCRAAFRLDNGRPREAAADMEQVAAIADTDYARALARSYSALPDDARDEDALVLPPLPTDPGSVDRYLAVFHLLRQERGAGVEAAMALLADADDESPYVRDLALRAAMHTAMVARRAERVEALQRASELAIRLEGIWGRQTALTANSLGTAFYLQLRYEQAAELLRAGIALAPEAHSIRINLGSVERNLGSPDGGREHFAAAIRLRPKSFGARRALLFSLLDGYEFEAADQLVKDAPYAPGDDGIGERHWMQGEVLIARARHAALAGQPDRCRELGGQAVKEFEAGVRFGDQRAKSSLFVARALAGEFEDLAVEVIRKLENDPLDWRSMDDLVATMPKSLNAEQTEALRDYLVALRQTLAPQRLR